MSLAYKFAATMLMLAEVNFFCDQTGLSPGRPFTQNDVLDGSYIGPPYLKHFTGSVLTKDYFFGFGWGHLANFRKRGFMPTDSDQSIKERNVELSKIPSQIDQNRAFQLATNWLSAVGIDVPTIEEKYRREMIQWRHYPDGFQREALVLPVYQIEWRGNILRSRPTVESAVVTVTIFGATKELIEYSVLDESLFMRPRIQINEMGKLLAIPDDEFREYDSQQRSNLVARSSILLPYPKRGPLSVPETNSQPTDLPAPER